METKDKAKYVFITGASRGIGEATAIYLVNKGFTVFAGVRKHSDGDSLRKKPSERLIPIVIDVTDKKAISSASEEIASVVGDSGLHGLVNNAGIPLAGPFEFLPLDEFRQELEVNVLGAVATTQAFLPLLRKGRGRIVNMSSISGLIALPFVGPYAATKFALEAFSDSLRVELRPWGIAVIVVEPGDVATTIWEKAADTMERVISHFPPQFYDLYGPVLGKLDDLKIHGFPPDQVARIVETALVVSRPKARYIVGQDAKVLALVRKLPVRIRDWIIARQIPKYGG